MIIRNNKYMQKCFYYTRLDISYYKSIENLNDITKDKDKMNTRKLIT